MDSNLEQTAADTTDLHSLALDEDGLNTRQRKFADLYLEGHFAKRAAILAGYSRDNAARIATRLLRMPAVAAYITTARKNLAEDRVYDRRVLTDWLWKVIHTPIDQIEEGDNIIQEQSSREYSNGNRTRHVKMVNKMTAFRELNRMLGYDTPFPITNWQPFSALKPHR